MLVRFGSACFFVWVVLLGTSLAAEEATPPRSLESVISEKLKSLPPKVATPRMTDLITRTYEGIYLDKQREGLAPADVLVALEQGTVSADLIGEDGYEVVFTDPNGLDFIRDTGQFVDVVLKWPEKRIAELDEFIDVTVRSFPDEFQTAKVRLWLSYFLYNQYSENALNIEDEENVLEEWRKGVFHVGRLDSGKIHFEFEMPETLGIEVKNSERRSGERDFIRVDLEIHNYSDEWQKAPDVKASLIDESEVELKSVTVASPVGDLQPKSFVSLTIDIDTVEDAKSLTIVFVED